jgi:cytochrome c-type biogenesis protein CcmH/NrfG
VSSSKAARSEMKALVFVFVAWVIVCVLAYLAWKKAARKGKG